MKEHLKKNAHQYRLLGLLVICGVCTCLSRNLLVSLVIFMAYSLIMSVVWALLMAPDLAVTEAAVGAALTPMVFIIALKKMRGGDD